MTLRLLLQLLDDAQRAVRAHRAPACLEIELLLGPTKATKDLRYLWPRLPAAPLISRRDNQPLSSGYEHRSRATANRPAGHMD